jgi:KDO2-lipid IV(A) lauroyltransferase
MKLADRLAAWLLSLVLVGLRLLPIEWASAIPGGVARAIGPFLGTSAKARARLQMALPGLTGPEYDRIISGMWDNLGRVFGEYAHLDRISCFGPGSRATVLGTEHVDRAKARGRPIILVSGHLGNWEVGYIAAHQYGLTVRPIYRAVNNPAIDALMLKIRRSTGVDPIAKGSSGARAIIAALKGGQTLTMLVDQKMNDGIAVPFFGREAMTASAAAELALRHDATLLPARVERLNGARFRITVYPALDLPRSGNRQADVLATMTAVNTLLEDWIRERPDQWFWVHRRWRED